ncbi:MAG TPA: alanine--tRNA ligase-related protein, partial [Brevibacterium sp.]|nr:alanine--tRNA ligase-related protein [Brevibacterium sp.]
MVGSYPELEAAFGEIADVAYGEEEAFRRTLSAGSTILDTAVAKAKQTAGSGGTTPRLSGEEAFTLHDTYGFPIDLTLEMAAEHGVAVDEKGFREHMAAQRERARADALAKKAGGVDPRLYQDLRATLAAPTEFLGYTDTTAEVRLAGMLVDGQPVPTATAPAEVELVLDRTPFYAEAGGQLADRGSVSFTGGGLVDIVDVQSPLSGMSVHRGTLVEGTLTLDETGVASIDVERRRAIARAHTGTHMVHKALHETLGEQATQAGSENAPSRLRLDFRHGSSVPSSALSEIEERVNLLLADDLEVTDSVMPLERAKELGALALFGEKYGEHVRVVSIGGDWSRELCAGTHVPTTGYLGRIALLGESSIGSGVRRVDALVGEGAYRHQAQQQVIINQVTQLLGSRPEELPERISTLMARLKSHEKELASLRQAQLLASAESIVAAAERVGDVRVVLHDAGTGVGADDARRLALDLRSR